MLARLGVAVASAGLVLASLVPSAAASTPCLYGSLPVTHHHHLLWRHWTTVTCTGVYGEAWA